MPRMRSDCVCACTEAVKKWTSTGALSRSGLASSITGLDMWIVPMFRSCHWTCAVVYLPEKRLAYFDSLHVRVVFASPHPSACCSDNQPRRRALSRP